MVIKATILSHLRGDTVKVFKKKRRKGYQKLNGHRQYLTQIQIDSIGEGKAEAKPEKKVVAKTLTPKAEATTVEKPVKAAPKAKKETAEKPEKKVVVKKAVKAPAAKKTAAPKKAVAKKPAKKKEE